MSTGADAIKKAMEEAAAGNRDAAKPETGSADRAERNPDAETARPKTTQKRASSGANTKQERKTSRPPGRRDAAEEEERKVTVRLPAGLHRRIRIEAASSDRTMQTVITDILDARVPGR